MDPTASSIVLTLTIVGISWSSYCFGKINHGKKTENLLDDPQEYQRERLIRLNKKANKQTPWYDKSLLKRA